MLTVRAAMSSTTARRLGENTSPGLQMIQKKNLEFVPLRLPLILQRGLQTGAGFNVNEGNVLTLPRKKSALEIRRAVAEIVARTDKEQVRETETCNFRNHLENFSGFEGHLDGWGE